MADKKGLIASADLKSIRAHYGIPEGVELSTALHVPMEWRERLLEVSDASSPRRGQETALKADLEERIQTADRCSAWAEYQYQMLGKSNPLKVGCCHAADVYGVSPIMSIAKR
ncbi:hypothetical protein ACLOJK_013128 [Asimina triloba]